MSVAVSACGLTRVFRGAAGEVRALDGVDLAIGRGRLFVVRGPSGCGKSTLLNLIGLLDRCTGGSLWVAGVDLTALDRREAALFRRRHVGFLFQDAGLIDRMSVASNVAGPLLYRRTPPSRRRALVMDALERVGLAHRAWSCVGTLSGGERHRTGLARALVAEPAVLVCDEPTASLDAQNSVAVADLLGDVAAGGATVVCSSHDPILIERADTCAEMLYGRVVGGRRS